MDWKKIKKILIIALLIANAVLFIYINYNNIRLGNESSRMDFSKEVEGLLEEKDIKIDTNIPRKVKNYLLF